MERHLGRVHLMVGTIVHVGMDAQHRESAQDTCIGSFPDAFTHRRDIFLGNGTTHHGRFEQKHGRLVDQDIGLRIKVKLLTVCLQRCKFHLTMTILSTSTGLFCILGIHFHCLGKRLFVCNLGRTYVCFHLELTQQSVHDDLQVKFTHTSNDGLACLRIGVGTESRILLCQLGKGLSHLALTGFGLWLNGQLDNRLRKLHGFQNHGMLFIADGITSCSEFKAYCGSNVTGIYLFQLCTLVGMHLQDTAYTLFLAFCGIEYIGTGIDSAGIYTEECKLSYKRICHDLEGQCREGFLIGGMSLHFIAVHIGSLDGRDVRGSRHILQDCIQKLLDTPVAVCRTTAHRNGTAVAGSLAQGFLHVLHRRFFTLQIEQGEIIIQLTYLLYQLGTVQFRIICHISQVIGDSDILTLVIIVDVGFHLEQINDSLKFIFLSNGKLNADGILTKSCFNHFYRIVEISTQDVHLVDERHTGYIVGVSLTPYVL